MQREPVFLRIDGHGAQAELVGGAKDADGDFAAIGRQQFAMVWFRHLRSAQCVARNSTLFHGGDATELQFFDLEEPSFLWTERDVPRNDSS